MKNRTRQIPSIVTLHLVLALATTASFAADASTRRRTADDLVGRGLRRIESKHLILYTDLDEAAEVDELAHVFDLAVPQWREYFKLEDPRQTDDWRMTAYIMKQAQRFRDTQLLPDDLPPFLHGYQYGDELWVHEQPSSYYRRHLLLHEGTHGFMYHWLGANGPPWLSEGLSEYLGTHSWKDGRLQLGYMPRSTQDVPHLGRVKIIKDEVAAGRAMSLSEVLQYGPRAHLDVEPYAWCWAAVALMEQHAGFRDALHAALQDLDSPPETVHKNLRDRLGDRWNELELNWQVLLANMDYGYDVEKAAVHLAERPAQSPIAVLASRSWQSTGIKLEKGKSYELSASGRFQIAKGSKPWMCEPNGVTIHYYHGRPLGLLLAAVVPDDEPEQLRNPTPIGLNATITPEESGTLFFCINENPAELGDNEGEIRVEIK